MNNVFFYLTVKEMKDYYSDIRLQDCINNINVIGIIVDSEVKYKNLYDYQCYAVSEVNRLYYDYIICTKARIKNLQGIVDRKKIIDLSVFKLPKFDFKKYVRIREKRPSIISNTCWGGLTYHSLKMPFYSPFINMFIEDEDYIFLLKNFHEIMKENLQFYKMSYDVNVKREYPICVLGEVKLHCNHYTSFELVQSAWNRRRERINYKNLIVEAKIENYKMAEEFSRLEFENKIGFAKEEYGLDSVVCIDLFESQKVNELMQNEFWRTVTDMAKTEKSNFIYYDVLSLLNNEGVIWNAVINKLGEKI